MYEQGLDFLILGVLVETGHVLSPQADIQSKQNILIILFYINKSIKVTV